MACVKLRHWLASSALLPLAVMTGGQAANADVTVAPPWPGLPATTWRSPFSPLLRSMPAQGNGLSEVARARQWIRIPNQAAAALGAVGVTHLPAGDPQQRTSITETVGRVFLSSPAGARHGYGIGRPVTIHTVAFGAIPVRATLQLEQLRDAEGFPVPLISRDTKTGFDGEGARPRFESEIAGKVRVRLVAMSVDGVDVGLDHCVSPPINLELHANGYNQTDPLHDPNVHTPGNDLFDPDSPPTFKKGTIEAANWMASLGEAGSTHGGMYPGNLDIPAFSDCATRSGEDLSPLLTAAVSGRGNRVSVGVSSIELPEDPSTGCGTFLPPPLDMVMVARGPYLGDPANCNPDYGPPTLNYPARPADD